MLMSRHQPLNEHQLRQHAPSIFAEAPHERVSHRYEFISTQNIIERLDREGWQPAGVMQSRTRDLSRKEHTKHIVRFRRFDEALSMIGDSYPEIVVINAHDGSSSYQLHAGLFRLICLNGMVIADSHLGRMKRRHTGESVQEIIEGTYEVVEELPKVTARVNNFRQIELSPREQTAFAEAATKLRWAPDNQPILPEQLLHAHRTQDKKMTFGLPISEYKRICSKAVSPPVQRQAGEAGFGQFNR